MKKLFEEGIKPKDDYPKEAPKDKEAEAKSMSNITKKIIEMDKTLKQYMT